MTHVSVYEQTCHGVVQYRVMRDDGRLIFDRFQTDFESEQEAISAIRGEFRRKKLGRVSIRVRYMGGNQLPDGRERVREFDDTSPAPKSDEIDLVSFAKSLCMGPQGR
jgi:hypothetical protein